MSVIYFSVTDNISARMLTNVELEAKYLSYQIKNLKISPNLAAATSFIFSSNSSGSNSNVTGQNASFVPVLLYHRLPDKGDKSNTSFSTFESQMMKLKKDGWNTVSLSDYLQYVEGKKTLPAKSFLLTFDDGARESYIPADPLLKYLGYRAVMFTLPKYSLRAQTTYYLSKYDLRRMIDSGRWEIEAHGYDSHVPITIDAQGYKGNFFADKMWLPDKNRLETEIEYKTRVVADLSFAKDALEKGLNIKIVAFAYPFGDFGQRSATTILKNPLINDTASNYYKLLFAQIEYGTTKIVNPLGNGSYIIRRLEVDPSWDATTLESDMTNLPQYIKEQNN